MKKENLRKFNTMITESHKEFLTRYSKEWGVTESAILREALDTFIKKELKKS